MPVAASRRTVKRFRGIARFREAALDRYQGKLVQIASQIEAEVLAIAAELDLEGGAFTASHDNLAALGRAQEQIDKALRESGYLPESSRYLRDTNARLKKQMRRAYRRLARRAAFTLPDLEALRLIVGAQFDAYANIGESGARALRELLVRAVTGQERFTSFTANLKQVLIGTGRRDKRGQGMFRHAQTLADTGMQQLHRTMGDRLSQSAGIERWAYFGPVDEVTRPFCRRLMAQARDGRTWTRKQIAALDNAPAGPGKGSAMISGGGWNCRHEWLPVLEAGD